jgi:hypothetical protein
MTAFAVGKSTDAGNPSMLPENQLYLIFLIATRFIVFAEFVFVMSYCIRRCLKRYITQMHRVGRDLHDLLG